MKHINSKWYLLVVFSMVMGITQAQIHIASTGSLHYSGGTFAYGVIDNTHGGTFSISANFAHSATNYVKGPVNITEAGTYDVSVGAQADSRQLNVTTSGPATVTYSATDDPATGRNETVNTTPTMLLADAEVYTFTGVTAATANALTTTQYGGEAADISSNPITTVFWSGSEWNTTTSSIMSFAAETATTLSVNGLNITGFTLYPNPVKTTEAAISYQLPNGIKQLSIGVYDLTGKQVQSYFNAPTGIGVNTIAKPQVDRGVYLMEFSFNNGSQKTTKKLLVE